jgi:ribosome biogenesis GTPase
MFVDLKDFGFSQADIAVAELLKDNGAIPARVTERQRNLYRVICENGETGAELKGSFYHTLNDDDEFPAVGDFVMIHYNDQGNSLISAVLPRRSKFSRANLSGHAEGYAKYIKEEVVASNFDYVFILSSLNFDFNPGRIARYITAVWQSGGFPVVLLTKSDLCEDPSVQIAETRKVAKDSPVIPISSKTGSGLEDLSPFLESGKTVVLLGSSGVGKSSLLNRLAGDTLMEVKAIRDDDSKGRHTTPHRQLFRLPSGVLVIDTPGLRELGLWDSREGISIAFADIEEIITQCRFSDCKHQSEPGCAVLKALDTGRITPEQWKQYTVQTREAAYVESHTVYLQKKREFHKTIAHYNKLRQKQTGDY